jgi:hypothetical protein
VRVTVVVTGAGRATGAATRTGARFDFVRFTRCGRAGILYSPAPAWAAIAVWMRAGRAGGLAARWTAPPPMIAPAAVQAQSFARITLTDIVPPCSRCRANIVTGLVPRHADGRRLPSTKTQAPSNGKRVNPPNMVKDPSFRTFANKRPNVEHSRTRTEPRGCKASRQAARNGAGRADSDVRAGPESPRRPARPGIRRRVSIGHIYHARPPKTDPISTAF